MKIISVVTELFHADGRKDGQTEGPEGRTDLRKLMVSFLRNFAKATKKKKNKQKEGS